MTPPKLFKVDRQCEAPSVARPVGPHAYRIISMTAADWRSPAGYEAASRFDAGAFAWEFVRRNPLYRSDYDRYRQGLTSEAADALAPTPRTMATTPPCC